jgi:transglutaminase-like putative cysteine protease
MRIRLTSALGLSFILLALPVGAQQASMSHEFVPPDPAEDVSLAATTLDGNLPAALDTPSGVATAPDPRKPPDPNHLYTGGSTDDSPDSTFPPDRDTRQPAVENYDDPFSPSTTPFKRLRAYDTFDSDYNLKVAVRNTTSVPVGGELGPGDDPFYADLSVELLPNDLVRIPTVGPGSRILKMNVSPTSAVTVLKDGAENWFLRGTERKRVRVVMQLAIPRATFGSDFADVEWSRFEGLVTRGGRTPRTDQVFAAIGLDPGMRPKLALGKMVQYFRSFQPSNDPPKTHGDIYLDLALSKKGVCRHRAFAFLVTANALGLPSRMVVNEAHAWVEAYDGTLWHRIDLGGAALDLDQEIDLNQPQHQPPSDPFDWPPGSQDNSGGGLGQRERSDAASDPNSPPTSDPNGSSALPDPNADPTNSSPVNPDAPAPTITFEVIDKSVLRGKPLQVKGSVVGAGSSGPCKNVRVDVMLRASDELRARAIGSLPTSEEGSFEGSVVVPRDVPAGDYVIFAFTRGDRQCGAGRSE